MRQHVGRFSDRFRDVECLGLRQWDQLTAIGHLHRDSRIAPAGYLRIRFGLFCRRGAHRCRKLSVRAARPCNGLGEATSSWGLLGEPESRLCAVTNARVAGEAFSTSVRVDTLSAGPPLRRYSTPFLAHQSHRPWGRRPRHRADGRRATWQFGRRHRGRQRGADWQAQESPSDGAYRVGGVISLSPPILPPVLRRPTTFPATTAWPRPLTATC
jgi:hypothetical protein